ncbi:winged helix-turn-helix transcriptional regulator [Sporosarcina sp. OR05]|uniref:winged helix-turn-helix transcriptional regulator n=1 Tax=Sporosarcina sp. OR05 TaxID=2969819 RepID=UPI00352A63D3
MRNSEECNPTTYQNDCDCFHEMIEFIGKRWTGIIVYRLLNGPKRYHELLADIQGISDRLLTERLRELETRGLIIKNVSEPGSRKVEYELTEIGKELEGIINAILKWVQANG